MHFLIIIMSVFLSSCMKNTITIKDIPDDQIITSSNRYVKINPYKNAPLSAELKISIPHDDLTISVKGQDGKDSDFTYTWRNATNDTFPILGLYFDYTNTVMIHTPTVVKEFKIVITNKAPEIINSISVLSNTRPITPERKNFLNFFNPVGALKDMFAVDNYGKIRWYLQNTNELHGPEFFITNDEVFFSILNTTTPEILTYNMVGKVVKTVKGPQSHPYNVPEADKRFHHELFQRSNGNIIVLDKSQYGVEDTILELDPQGKLVKAIRIGDWIRKTVNGNKDDNSGLEKFIFDSPDNPYDEYRSGIRYPGMPQDKNAIDWAHINAFSFDEKTQMIYLSFRQHGIFAFNYSTETLKWIFLRDDYILPVENLTFYNYPSEADIEYVYQIPKLQPYILKGAQGPDHPHAITFLSNNTFMVFDNSGNDGKSPEEGSRLLVFSIDQQNMRASIEWEYRHTNTNGTLEYAQIVSDIDKTASGNYIGLFGARDPFTYIEVDTNKNVLFDMRLDIHSRSTNDSAVALPIACPTSRLSQNTVFIYRADYAPIYPNYNLSID